MKIVKIRSANKEDLSGIVRLNLAFAQEGTAIHSDRRKDYLSLSRFSQRVE